MVVAYGAVALGIVGGLFLLSQALKADAYLIYYPDRGGSLGRSLPSWLRSHDF